MKILPESGPVQHRPAHYEDRKVAPLLMEGAGEDTLRLRCDYPVHEPSGEGGFYVAEPRARYSEDDHTNRRLHKAQRRDAEVFDRYEIPVPAGGGRREGLSDAVTRESRRRTERFVEGGGNAERPLGFVPAEWTATDPKWPRPEAWMLNEPWTEDRITGGWEQAKEFRKRGWTVTFHPCGDSSEEKRRPGAYTAQLYRKTEKSWDWVEYDVDGLRRLE